jgi:hypothetical protein
VEDVAAAVAPLFQDRLKLFMGYIVPLFTDMDEITFQELCIFIYLALFFVLCTILPIFCLHIKLFDNHGSVNSERIGNKKGRNENLRP